MKGFMAALVTIVVVIVLTFGLIVPIMQTGVATSSIKSAINFLEQRGYWVLAAGSGLAGDLIPDADATRDVGSALKRWEDIFASKSITVGTRELTDTGSQLRIDNVAIPRTATFVVAASNASTASKAQADFVCDGVADDVEIQAAIDALPAVFGGLVQLSAGNFYINASIILNTPRITLAGEDWSTVLTLTSAVDMIANTGALNIHYARFRNMNLQGGDFAANCFNLTSSAANDNPDIYWEGLLIAHFDGIGIYMPSCHSWNLRILNNVIELCATGIRLVSSGTYPENIFIIGNEIKINTATGIYIDGVSAYVNKLVITNNILVQHGQYGIQVKGADTCIIANNLVYTSSYGNANVYDGISVQSTSNALTDGIEVHDNVVSSATQKYGIHLYGTGAQLLRCKVYNNRILSYATSAFNQSALTLTTNDIVIENNMGYIAPGEIRTASGSLIAGVANAIGFAWHNPEKQDILIKKVIVEVTTGSITANSVIDVGIADDATGTNKGVEFFDDLDANDVDINDSWVAGDGGTQTKYVLCQDSVSATDGWVVGQILVADAAALAGKYYIEYAGR